MFIVYCFDAPDGANRESENFAERRAQNNSIFDAIIRLSKLEKEEDLNLKYFVCTLLIGVFRWQSIELELLMAILYESEIGGGGDPLEL